MIAATLAGCGRAPGDDQTATADLSPVEAGRRAFGPCAVCHSVKDPASGAAPRLVGPNLWGVVGRRAGGSDDFVYSKAMTASGVVWTDQTLDAYIAAPSDFIRGNRMAFAGIDDPDERAAIIAYLKSRR